MPGTLSPSSHHRKAPDNKAPIPEPITPGIWPVFSMPSLDLCSICSEQAPFYSNTVSAASPLRKFGRYPPAIHPNVPETASSTLPGAPYCFQFSKLIFLSNYQTIKVTSWINLIVSSFCHNRAAPVASPTSELPQNSPVSHPSLPVTLSPRAHHRKEPDNKAPIPEPITPGIWPVFWHHH